SCLLCDEPPIMDRRTPWDKHLRGLPHSPLPPPPSGGRAAVLPMEKRGSLASRAPRRLAGGGVLPGVRPLASTPTPPAASAAIGFGPAAASSSAAGPGDPSAPSASARGFPVARLRRQEGKVGERFRRLFRLRVGGRLRVRHRSGLVRPPRR